MRADYRKIYLVHSAVSTDGKLSRLAHGACKVERNRQTRTNDTE